MSETLLPPNTTPLERALEGATARITDIPVRARDLANPDAAPANTLPWLAWGVSVDNWETTWTTRQKRDTIKASNSIHRYKGTIGAVREALSALGFSVSVQEWFSQSPQGAPYTFKLAVEIDQDPVSLDGWDKLVAVVNNAKNLRSHLDTIELALTSVATPVLAAVTMMGFEIEVQPGGGNLRMDGTWKMNGEFKMNGLKI